MKKATETGWFVFIFRLFNRVACVKAGNHKKKIIKLSERSFDHYTFKHGNSMLPSIGAIPKYWDYFVILCQYLLLRQKKIRQNGFEKSNRVFSEILQSRENFCDKCLLRKLSKHLFFRILLGGCLLTVQVNTQNCSPKKPTQLRSMCNTLAKKK